MGRAGRAVAVFLLAVAGVFAVTAPASGQAALERATAAQQSISCFSLNALRRELLSLSRMTDPAVIPGALDSVIYRLSVIVPRVPVIPGNTLKVLLSNLRAQQTELLTTGLTPDLLDRIHDTATMTNGLLAYVNCV